MTKVQIQKVFDTAKIASTRSYTELQDFFEYFGNLVDNLVRILRKGIGLEDNVDCEVVTIDATHATAFQQKVKTKPIGILAIGANAPLARPLFWTLDKANSSLVTITADFVNASQGNGQPTKAQVTFVVFYS